ncbi:hypothetical protein GC105_15595 [Alkalibaculum sp. M08DMB]|uniref:Transglutaminase-like domain-containing protein n=1 Tax=Alkalibaculum sporogenes TaxID=2655001 RepID=A0A6A7KCW4_9FIRM|nr:transglutaminase-like domain-containing protein [Alkalibaculum sporogenes]MPW27195.1 hypothetical protein [Alkalibaculum sporogenes]
MRKNIVTIIVIILITFSMSFVQASSKVDTRQSANKTTKTSQTSVIRNLKLTKVSGVPLKTTQGKEKVIKTAAKKPTQNNVKTTKTNKTTTTTKSVVQNNTTQKKAAKATTPTTTKAVKNSSTQKKATVATTAKVAQNNTTQKSGTVAATETVQAKPAQTKATTTTNSTESKPSIDVSNANNGTVKAKYLSAKKLKVQIVKGDKTYNYDLKGDNKYQSYPLQMGDGTYKISVMENVEGNKYKSVLTKEAQVKTTNPNQKYLTSVQMINWSSSMAPIKKASSLASGSDAQKASKIYSFVVSSIKYNSDITSLPSGYVPNIETTYSSKKGICYDFASLYASMMRSVGVPTKLVKGTSSNVNGYHAWNEVYIDGKWRIVDTSYDSQLKAAGHSVTMYKSGGYSKQKEY